MKTWLITGCSSGLGRALAQAALAAGDQVVVTARHPEAVADIVANDPQRAMALALDVTDQLSIERAVQAALDHFGSIDVLVNNAGYGYRAAVEEGDMTDISRLFQTHVFGPLALIQAVLPGMRQHQKGTIINISSIAALSTSPGSGFYAAAKSALESMSEGLKKEVEPLGIRVMVVEPGAFRTDFAGRSLTQSEKEITAYAKTAGKRRIGQPSNHGRQPGDPTKAGAVLVQIVQQEKLPFRLLLGKDAVLLAKEVLSNRQKEYADWETWSQQTDFD